MGTQRAIVIVSFTALAAIAHIGAARRQLPVKDAPLQADAVKPQRLVGDDAGYPVDVSFDGRRVLVVKTDEDPSRLMIRHLVTNETTPLKACPLGWRVQRSLPAGAFSRDGTQIAFSCYEMAPQSPEGVSPSLHVIGNRNGAASRRLAGAGVVPHDWSRDLRRILVLIHGSLTDSTQIAWLSVADGALHTIKTLEPWRNSTDTGLRVSPNGKLVAYSARAREDSTDRYVYIIDANGQKERAVATLKGSNTQPVWMPDSAHLLFINTESGRRDLYAVSAREGERSAVPVKLYANFQGELVRVSASGDLFYRQTDDGILQVVADRRLPGARIAQAFPGRNGTWSKGNRLAFLGPGGLVIRSLDTGQERRCSRILNSPPQWLSDESAFIGYVTAAGDGGREGGSFYRVDAQTCEFTCLFARNTENYARSFVGVLSPDDRTFYLAARAKKGDTPWTRIVAVDLATGVERFVVGLAGDGLATAPALAVSPDGSALAIRAETGRIMTVRVDGREYRELSGSFPGFVHPGGRLAEGSPFMEWTPDGASIVFAADSPSAGWRIMRAPAAGGQAQSDGLESARPDSSVPIRRDIGSLINLDLSADGSRIAISSRANPAYDVWKLTNVVSVLGNTR